MSVRTVVLLGAGRVASSLAMAIDRLSGYRLIQVYSRQIAQAERLVEALVSTPSCTNKLEHIVSDADLYVYALADSALPEVWHAIPQTTGVWVHMSGGVALEPMTMYHRESAVVYPLQTFSYGREHCWSRIPLFVEGATEASVAIALDFAHALSDCVQLANSHQRCQIHIAGVIANNFTNHLIDLSQEYLEALGVPAQVLAPLVAETCRKLEALSAYEAQTGPARRGDLSTIERHISILAEHPQLLKIYELLSDSLHKRYNKSPQEE